MFENDKIVEVDGVNYSQNDIKKLIQFKEYVESPKFIENILKEVKL